MKPVLAITVGDCNGVGPEVVIRALRSTKVRHSIIPLLVGPQESFSYYARLYGIPFRPIRVSATLGTSALSHLWDSGHVPVLEPDGARALKPKPGLLSPFAARMAAQAISTAVNLVQNGSAAGIVTAPVSKKALHMAGVQYPGQTEMLQQLSGSRRVAMMLVSPVMRIGLATIHIPVRSIHKELTASCLKEKILIIREALQKDWRIPSPRLAVLGLNPHIGEDGDIGKEEQTVIIPVLRTLQRRFENLSGPFPADGFFGQYRPHSYDAIVAMYHDQGLIPLKMTAAGHGVNVSVGLPLVRTSPDHGTGFDIAGKGIADGRSMVEALCMARIIIHNRKRGEKRAS